MRRANNNLLEQAEIPNIKPMPLMNNLLRAGHVSRMDDRRLLMIALYYELSIGQSERSPKAMLQ